MKRINVERYVKGYELLINLKHKFKKHVNELFENLKIYFYTTFKNILKHKFKKHVNEFFENLKT